VIEGCIYLKNSTSSI